MEIAITKMSSKGQIVIPSEMRKEIDEGEKIVILKNKNQLILKKAKDFSKHIEEDLEFAKKTEEAWERYERGEFEEIEFNDFLSRIKNLT